MRLTRCWASLLLACLVVGLSLVLLEAWLIPAFGTPLAKEMADERRREKRKREQEFKEEMKKVKEDFQEEKKKLTEGFQKQIEACEKEVASLKNKLWAERNNSISVQGLLKKEKQDAEKRATALECATDKTLERHLIVWKKKLESEEQAMMFACVC